MIEVENISKSFLLPQNMISKYSSLTERSFYALSDISFEINKGEVIGLIGLNGAGKTTLIRVLAGLYEPEKGVIKYNNHPINQKPRISILTAGQGIYQSLSVESLIRYFGYLQNKNFNFDSKEVDDLIMFLGLKMHKKTKIETLSSGWKQKIFLLLAFLNDPELILLDEPSSYLDFLGQKELDELIDLFKKREKYIVYATHNLHEIEKKSDKIAFIDKGLLIFFDSKLNLLAKYNNKSLEEIVLSKLGVKKR
ncbi:MAG: ABC transporter ATP-binding protein [Candidatus Cloacimonetes bacterium]|nr:ABC transporter ATP-binding protein [Candidatus Cloacimonadota bacterium]